MKKVKLFEDYSLEEKKITLKWNDDDNSIEFSDGVVAHVDYDGEFQYRGEWFETIDHEGPEDLIKDLQKKFKTDKFVWEGVSYVTEGKVKVFIDKIMNKMVDTGLGVHYEHKLRQEIKDKIAAVVKETMEKYDYIVESNETLNEGTADVVKSYDKIIELLKKEARKLNDDDAYELHEMLKKFFDRMI